ncbi:MULTISPECIES: hypothetical protein [Streptomycetaceae]|uniref:hypothetical protein n=1 Tax=Streptomycetaceae TaxID=2062 RepID=UPI00037D514D|nr:MULTISPECIES: hypothetical protein [Streptomycetaceae]
MTSHESAHAPGTPATCGHWLGAEHRHCGTKTVRLYGTGLRCPAHTPAALAGRPEPDPGPGMPAGAWTTVSPLGTSALIDARAVASGKRRSSPHVYRAAQAAVSAAPAVTDLRVDLGEQDAHGRWVRYPSADYQCPHCGWTDSASGDAVPRFAATIRDTHRPHCPNRSTV